MGMFSILRNSANGEVVYQETHDVLTSQLGLFNLAIGQGLPEFGQFSDISWADDLYFLEISLDVEGNGDYIFYGAQQLLAVPYAINAAEAANARGLTLYSGGQEFFVKVDGYGNLYTEKGQFNCGGLFFDDRDGQVYETVQIGDQCWFKQNLNFVTDSSWCYEDDPANCEVYGRLYANNMAQKACPEGWHLPDEDEWCQLVVFLDETVDCGLQGVLGTDAGGKMKELGILGEDGLWAPPNAGATNESGFSALPGGFKHPPTYWDKNVSATFWSVGEAGTDWYYYWRMTNTESRILHLAESYVFGFSVRCVMDQ